MSNSKSFVKYASQFSKNATKEQTHTAFNNGRFLVTDEVYPEFYKAYFEAMQSGEDLYIIEKVSNSKFAFFMDIDAPQGNAVSASDVGCIIQKAFEVAKDMFKDVDQDAYIVSKRRSVEKYHINFHKLIVDNIVAKRFASLIVEQLPEAIGKCIDMSVYRTGLRMLGSKKTDRLVKEGESNTCYEVYDLQTGKALPNDKITFDRFMKTVVRRTSDVALTSLTEKFEKLGTENSVESRVHVKGVENAKVVDEIASLLNNIKDVEHDGVQVLKEFDMSIQRIYAKQNKAGFFCYYVSINEKLCPFKHRHHQRANSPIYIEISVNGIFVKCYDEECLRRRFPENGFRLPSSFDNQYPQLHLSMTTKYWKTELKIDDELKATLESSVSGSHYQVAKAAFQIYKDRFRVDDVRNTDWYEFDGQRWKKSHNMNILVSEELPEYYKGIKISDTSIQSKNLQEFLVNTDKVDANVRNQKVDNIISRLENVSYKSSMMNQLAFLFKTHDEDFVTQLDSNPYLVGFNNGVYDFSTNTFRKGRQDDYLTFSTGYDFIEYDENNRQVQEIYDFLSKILTNTAVREYTLKVLAKSLVGIPEEKFYIWTGLSGANGKSTLINFLETTLGDYITSVDVSLLTNKRGGSSNASPDVVRLRGKRIFTFQEPEHDDKLRTGILKQFTGGDTVIARELFKAPVTFKLQGTMIMCCNDLPSVSSIDGGTWRRIRVVEFNSRFCDNPTKENEFKIDPFIKTRIQEWRPYFMSILIHWYQKYKEEGLYEPEEVRRATENYKVENDKINEYFDECIEESDSNFESVKKIYNTSFREWWSKNYPTSKIPDMKDFRRSIKVKYGVEKTSIINGLKQTGFYVSIKNNMMMMEDSGSLEDL
jgi:P4 family phage/plasmid primase-like protien